MRAAFSNDEETYRHFTAALEISGERFWRLPLEEEYKEQIKSNIADIMNTGVSRWGGAINAAMFLKEFVEDTPWIHLDIAGVAWTEEQKPWMAKGPSGIAVRTITEWVRTYAIAHRHLVREMSDEHWAVRAISWHPTRQCFSEEDASAPRKDL